MNKEVHSQQSACCQHLQAVTSGLFSQQQGRKLLEQRIQDLVHQEAGLEKTSQLKPAEIDVCVVPYNIFVDLHGSLFTLPTCAVTTFSWPPKVRPRETKRSQHRNPLQCTLTQGEWFQIGTLRYIKSIVGFKHIQTVFKLVDVLG